MHFPNITRTPFDKAGLMPLFFTNWRTETTQTKVSYETNLVCDEQISSMDLTVDHHTNWWAHQRAVLCTTGQERGLDIYTFSKTFPTSDTLRPAEKSQVYADLDLVKRPSPRTSDTHDHVTHDQVMLGFTLWVGDLTHRRGGSGAWKGEGLHDDDDDTLAQMTLSQLAAALGQKNGIIFQVFSSSFTHPGLPT